MSPIPSPALQEITSLLETRIGLNAISIGRQTLEHAISIRMAVLKLLNATEYVQRLRANAEEWQAFVEEMIVPESWFFREITPFECIRAFMQQVERRKPLRLLSIPCSRGEEPYSLAMTLLDVGLLPLQFEILGCDLSLQSLAFARRGRYRAIAFREQDANAIRLTQKHFVAQADVSEISASVRGAVKFRHANLASHDFLKDEAPFDIIFCRNVLIYLTELARQNAFAHFRRLLVPGGLLYLGHSECRLGPQAGCSSWNPRFPAAFSWLPVAAAELMPPTPYVPVKHEAHSAAKPHVVKHKAPAKKEAAIITSPVAEILDRARTAANAGQLEEAESLCNAWMQQSPPDADSLCLLGVIHQSRGDNRTAETYYQKALFLSPNHEESLTHMLLLSQLRGDAAQAANFQRRLSRWPDAEVSA